MDKWSPNVNKGGDTSPRETVSSEQKVFASLKRGVGEEKGYFSRERELSQICFVPYLEVTSKRKDFSLTWEQILSFSSRPLYKMGLVHPWDTNFL